MKKLLFTAILLSLYVTAALATPGVNDWQKAQPLETLYIDEGRDTIEYNFQAIDRLQSNYRRGCDLVYNSIAQITVRDGEVTVSNSGGTTRVMMKKSTDTTVTWANIDTGTEATSTTYYVYAVATGDDDQEQSYVISASSTAPTGSTYYRRLGSFYNNASGNIEKIINDDPVVMDQYESDWFSVSATSTNTLTHGLNTLNIFVILYYASDSSGTDMEVVANHYNDGSSIGGLIKSITRTQLTTQCGTSYVQQSISSSGTVVQRASGYYKVIAFPIK